MKNFVNALTGSASVLAVAVMLSSCGSGTPTSSNPGKYSTTTGLEFNEEGGFVVNDFSGQPEGPNLIFIEGGRTVLGTFEEDVLNSNDNVEREC